MKRLLSHQENLQRFCVLCKRQLPLRSMVILCIVCEHKLVGGGDGDALTLKGVEIIYFLHQLVQNIHARRLQGDYSIPSVEVDSVMEERYRLVIAGSETADDWWLQSPIPGVDPIETGGALLSSPVEGGHGCPSSLNTSTASGSLKNSRAVRLARLAELTRTQAAQSSSDARS